MFDPALQKLRVHFSVGRTEPRIYNIFLTGPCASHCRELFLTLPGKDLDIAHTEQLPKHLKLLLPKVETEVKERTFPIDH